MPLWLSLLEKSKPENLQRLARALGIAPTAHRFLARRVWIRLGAALPPPGRA